MILVLYFVLVAAAISWFLHRLISKRLGRDSGAADSSGRTRRRIDWTHNRLVKFMKYAWPYGLVIAIVYTMIGFMDWSLVNGFWKSQTRFWAFQLAVLGIIIILYVPLRRVFRGLAMACCITLAVYMALVAISSHYNWDWNWSWNWFSRDTKNIGRAVPESTSGQIVVANGYRQYRLATGSSLQDTIVLGEGQISDWIVLPSGCQWKCSYNPPRGLLIMFKGGDWQNAEGETWPPVDNPFCFRGAKNKPISVRITVSRL